MSLQNIVVVILVLAMIATLPTWPHSKNWGYYPTGGISVVLVLVVVLISTWRT